MAIFFWVERAEEKLASREVLVFGKFICFVNREGVDMLIL